MRNLALVLTVVLFLFCPSCSIWEDREHCPGILALDCSLLEGKALYADIWIFSTAGILLAKNRISEHDFHKLQEYEVPKDDNIGKVTITKAYIEGTGGPLIEMRGQQRIHTEPVDMIDN